MFTVLRTGAIASAFIGLTMLATPAVAVQAQTAPVAAVPQRWSLPATQVTQPVAVQATVVQAPVVAQSAPQAAAAPKALAQPVLTTPVIVSAQPATQSAVVSQPVVRPALTPQPAQPIVKNPFASLPAVVRSIVPAVNYPRSNRSLQDMVASYVNYGDQDQQQDCLAKAIYFEARSEPLEGQLAVADVVLNRAASGKYPPTICEVVTQPWQFSFVNATRSIPEPNKGSRAWHNAVAIADIARKNLAEVVPANVLWYHANYVSPSWGRRLNRVTQIGLHIFYS